jgi:hypothetical protein
VSAFVLAVPLTFSALAPLAQARDIHLAGGGKAPKQKPAQPNAEPSKEPSPSPTAQAAGPPWTYQMSKISLVLLALMLLAVAGAYYRFVFVRRRGTA